MTGPSPRTSTAVIARAALNYPLIRARVADLGLLDATFTELVGVSPYRLEHDCGQRTISLIVLARLARVLDVSLDDLVLTDAVATPPSVTAASGDDSDSSVVLAALATYGGLAVGRALSLLGWTRARLDSALADIAEKLAATALRVAITDDRLQLLLRPDALPASVRERFDHDQATQRPLDPSLAVALLVLVRNKILEPFPEEPDDFGRSDLSRTNIDPALLIGRRIAVTAPRFSSDQQHDPGLQIHPDIMFALRLADEPAPDGTPRVRE